MSRMYQKDNIEQDHPGQRRGLSSGAAIKKGPCKQVGTLSHRGKRQMGSGQD